MKAADLWAITKKTVTDFSENNPMNYAAILSYYTVFSLPAVIILILRLAGLVLGQEAVSGELFGQLSGIVGAQTAKDIQGIVAASSKSDSGTVATIVGLVTLIISGTTVFVALQEALNNVWGVKAKPEKGWLKYLINRGLSVSVVGAIAFLLLVSLAVEAAVRLVSGYLQVVFGPFAELLAKVIDLAVSAGFTTVLFAIIFKVLPDAVVRWRNVWTGAFITALLFSIGRSLIGWYIEFSDTESAYGAAGSVVLLMVWVYYSAVILLLGAEFTKVYSLYNGQEIEPSAHAVKVEVKEVHKNADGAVEVEKDKTAEKHHNALDA